MKKIGDLTVNDGNGLYDNEGLCDTLLLDLNRLPKLLIEGQFIQACAVVSSMGQRLVNLKECIKKDHDSMKEKVDELKRVNDELAEQVYKVPVERDDDNGEN